MTSNNIISHRLNTSCSTIFNSFNFKFRVHIGGGEELYPYMKKDILPKEWGGKAGTFDELNGSLNGECFDPLSLFLLFLFNINCDNHLVSYLKLLVNFEPLITTIRDICEQSITGKYCFQMHGRIGSKKTGTGSCERRKSAERTKVLDCLNVNPGFSWNWMDCRVPSGDWISIRTNRNSNILYDGFSLVLDWCTRNCFIFYFDKVIVDLCN